MSRSNCDSASIQQSTRSNRTGMCLLSTVFPLFGGCRPRDGVSRDAARPEVLHRSRISDSLTHENRRFSDDGRHRGPWTLRPWPWIPREGIIPMVSEACPTNPREASGLDPEAVHWTKTSIRRRRRIWRRKESPPNTSVTRSGREPMTKRMFYRTPESTS